MGAMDLVETLGLRPRTLPFVSLVVLATTAVVSTILAVIFASIHILRHKRQNHHPLLQRYTMRILFMVPLYSVSCLTSLLARSYRLARVMEVVRMLFETVVIFSFLQYILVCAGGVKALICRFRPRQTHGGTRSLGSIGKGASVQDTCSSDDSGTSSTTGSSLASTEASEVSEGKEAGVAATLDIALGAGSSSDADGDPEKPSCPQSSSSHLRTLRHLPVLGRCLPPWRSGRQMLTWCIRGTLAYILTGIAYAIFKIVHFFLTSSQDHSSVKDPYDAVARASLVISQGLAISGLTTLGLNMMEDLIPLRGHWKFLSVKLVIFFTFWQSLVLHLLEHFGALQPMVDQALNWKSPKDVACALQNWLICLEMLVASIVHFKVWPPHDYLTMLAQLEIRRDRLDSPRTQMTAKRMMAVDLRDIYETAESVMRTKSV